MQLHLGGYLSELSESYADLLRRYEWQWFCTLTFRNPPHPESASKRFRYWVGLINRELYGRTWYKKKKSIYWALALEYHRSGVIHFHCLLGDNVDMNETMSRIWAKNEWYGIGGYARISPVPRTDDGQVSMITGYVSKYVSKGGMIDLSENLSQFNSFHQQGMGRR